MLIFFFLLVCLFSLCLLQPILITSVFTLTYFFSFYICSYCVFYIFHILMLFHYVFSYFMRWLVFLSFLVLFTTYADLRITNVISKFKVCASLVCILINNVKLIKALVPKRKLQDFRKLYFDPFNDNIVQWSTYGLFTKVKPN